MRTNELRIIVYEYTSILELTDSDQQLVLASRDACKKAYAPYSKFNVGAAILLENSEIIQGNNQENAAFTSGLCAERVALFYASSKYPDVSVNTIAISAENITGLVDQPVKPCGSCRQVFVETESRFKKPIRIILDGKKSILLFEGADNLLPFAFKPDSLG